MYLAAKTTASSAEIWAIVIVAVICLAFWLVMVVGIAPRPAARQRHGRQPPQVPLAGGRQAPVAGGVHASESDRSVAPSRDEPAMAMPAPASAAARASAETGVTDTRDDLRPVPRPRRPAPPPRAPSADKPDMAASTSEPGVQWTARTPAQRESATDQAVPHRDRDSDG